MASIGDAAAKSVTKFVTKVFWPWFLKNIWPLIATALVAFVGDRIQEFFQRIESAVQSANQTRAAEAQESAAEAEGLAAAAVTDAERDKQEAIANVWRTVAEQLRGDNEQLRQQLSALASVQQDVSDAEMQSMTPVLEDNGSHVSLSIAGSRTVLPALPSAGGAAL